MRIAITATTVWSENSYRNAGISRFGLNLIEALVRLYPADPISVFTHGEFEPPARWADFKNLTTEARCPAGRGAKAFWETFGAGKLSRSGNFDVWLSTHHAAPWPSGVPCVSMIHDMIPLRNPEFHSGLQSGYLRVALVNVARRADHLLTNSEASKHDIVHYSGVDPEKITVIPLGPGSPLHRVAPEDAPCALLEKLPAGRFFFGLGTLEPRKNLPALFTALAQLQKMGQFDDVHLVLAGGRGWKEQGIFDELGRLGIQDRVVFLGYVPDEWLPFLFALSEAFVFPSLYEGFGMPILEAMLAGAPVISSEVGAVKEVGGDAAIYFDPTKPDAIAEALKGYLEGRFGARSIRVEKGLERSGLFTWDLAAHRTYKALAGLVRS
jgi:glycosyltransferase involved in cell wall biosynthesis